MSALQSLPSLTAQRGLSQGPSAGSSPSISTSAAQAGGAGANAASVDAIASKLEQTRLDSIDADVSDRRTLKQKLLNVCPDEDVASQPSIGEGSTSLATFLQGKVFAEGGECVISVGREDSDGTRMELSEDEFRKILTTVPESAATVGVQATVLVSTPETRTAYILLRQIPEGAQDFVEIRVACVGNVDAGKSTTLGVLTRGGLDDGRGKARVNLFRHRHEIETGRTSSVGMELLGLTASGEHVVNAGATAKDEGRKLSWEEVCARSAKIVNFLDLAGHERYLRTTIGGLTANIPEYGMLMVGANAGLIGMSKEHLGVALALSIPVFVTVTKVDMCPPQILESTIKQLTKVLKSPGCRKTPIFVDTVEQAVDCALRLSTERICPIFQISNVTGQNTDLLRAFLNVLPQSSAVKFDAGAPFELQISDIFSVPFVGTVVSGVITGGAVKTGDSLLIGPDSLGQFIPTAVRSIQRKRVNVDSAIAGQSVSFALKRVRRNQVRKGMVMIARSDNPPQASLVFDAEILCLHHATTLSVGSCMVLHAAGIRQTVRIIQIAKLESSVSDRSNDGGADQSTGTDEKPVIRTGDRAKLRLQFIRNPEFVKPGVRLITREGRTRLIGRIADVGGKGPLSAPGLELKA
ncbi:unnamed protein product [Parajaminaea phylloscopi]